MTDTVTSDEKARVLRELHRPGKPLVLPNAWDAASAREVESAGFPVVATGSAAVAPALGYADKEATPVGEMLAAVGRIARAVTVPVTADLERGYGLAPAELVERLVATGAVGCNLEDSRPETGELVDAHEQADYLAAVRAAATEARTGLVVNARVDVPAGRPDETIRRARLYLGAGADCVYPIHVNEPAVIGELVREIGAPVNVLFRPGSPALPVLAALGVARVSYGHGLHAAAQAHLRRMIGEIRQDRSPYDLT